MTHEELLRQVLNVNPGQDAQLEVCQQRIAELERWQTVDLENYKQHFAELEEQLTKLRQDVWDALGILGDDLDGDPTPAAVVSDLGEWLKGHARLVQEELDEAGNEAVELEEMLTAATDVAVQRGYRINRVRAALDVPYGLQVEESVINDIREALDAS